MKTIFLCFLILSVQLLSQGWNNIVTTTINEPNCERIDLFTNKDGNHIVIQNVNISNSIKYYLLNSSGTVVRSTTIETSSGAQFPNISGDNDKIFIVYKLGSNIIAKKSTDAGTNWSTNITPLPIGNNYCNGVDIEYDSRGLHVVYATQDAAPDFETYYYKLNSNNNWVDYKNVTDGSGEESEFGGLPRIALSANKVHVVYNTGEGVWEGNNNGSIISRDKYLVNNTWEDPLLAFEPPSNQGAYNQQVIIDNNNIEWCFTLLVFPPPQTENIWIALVRSINGSWAELGELPPQGSQYVQQLTFSLSRNIEGKIFTFYSVQSNILELYKIIIVNGSIISSTSTSEIHPLPLQLKSSSISNDVYLVWRNSGSNYLSYQQYDAAPSAPQNLQVSSNSYQEAVLSWSANLDPDVVDCGKYKIYRGEVIGSGEPTTWDIVATIDAYSGSTPVTTWTDPESLVLPYKGRWLHYKITALDKTLHESVFSNKVKIPGKIPKRNAGNGNNLNYEYALDQSFPNPFNPTTKISYSLQKEGLVTIKVFDVLGNEVATLVNEIKPAGFYEVELNASNLPSGIYFYKMQAGKFMAINKMVLAR